MSMGKNWRFVKCAVHSVKALHKSAHWTTWPLTGSVLSIMTRTNEHDRSVFIGGQKHLCMEQNRQHFNFFNVWLQQQKRLLMFICHAMHEEQAVDTAHCWDTSLSRSFLLWPILRMHFAKAADWSLSGFVFISCFLSSALLFWRLQHIRKLVHICACFQDTCETKKEKRSKWKKANLFLRQLLQVCSHSWYPENFREWTQLLMV